MSCNSSIIEYIISRGGNDYFSLIESASTYGKFRIVMKYWDKLTKNYVQLNQSILYNAFNNVHLGMIKFLVERRLVNQNQLQNSLKDLKNSLKELKSRHRRLHEATEYKGKTYKLEAMDKQIVASDSIIAYLRYRV